MMLNRVTRTHLPPWHQLSPQYHLSRYLSSSLPASSKDPEGPTEGFAKSLEARKPKSKPAPRSREPKPFPTKVIKDYISPTPALRLATLLKDILPHTTGPNDTATQGSRRHLALPDHLVYWPLPTPAGELAVDGADGDHVPKGHGLAGPHDPVAQGVRLWKGGSVVFKKGWRLCFPMACQLRLCTESGSKTSDTTNIHREYGYVGRNGRTFTAVEETRDLVFVKDRIATRVIQSERPDEVTPKGKAEEATPDADVVHDFVTTPAQLFQFSALTYNAHFIHLNPTSGLVHGPLLEALMLRVVEHHIERASTQGREVGKLEYVCRKPLRVGTEARVCLKEAGKGSWKVWVERKMGGEVVAEGTVETVEER